MPWTRTRRRVGLGAGRSLGALGDGDQPAQVGPGVGRDHGQADRRDPSSPRPRRRGTSLDPVDAGRSTVGLRRGVQRWRSAASRRSNPAASRADGGTASSQRRAVSAGRALTVVAHRAPSPTSPGGPTRRRRTPRRRLVRARRRRPGRRSPGGARRRGPDAGRHRVGGGVPEVVGADAPIAEHVDERHVFGERGGIDGRPTTCSSVTSSASPSAARAATATRVSGVEGGGDLFVDEVDRVAGRGRERQPDEGRPAGDVPSPVAGVARCSASWSTLAVVEAQVVGRSPRRRRLRRGSAGEPQPRNGAARDDEVGVRGSRSASGAQDPRRSR